MRLGRRQVLAQPTQGHRALCWSIPSVCKVSGGVGVTWPCISHSCLTYQVTGWEAVQPGGEHPGRQGWSWEVSSMGDAALLSKAGAPWLSADSSWGCCKQTAQPPPGVPTWPRFPLCPLNG